MVSVIIVHLLAEFRYQLRSSKRIFKKICIKKKPFCFFFTSVFTFVNSRWLHHSQQVQLSGFQVIVEQYIAYRYINLNVDDDCLRASERKVFIFSRKKLLTKSPGGLKKIKIYFNSFSFSLKNKYNIYLFFFFTSGRNACRFSPEFTWWESCQ